MLLAGIGAMECLEFRVLRTRQSSCWGSAAKWAKLEFLTWLRIGSGMLQVHKELGSVSLNCQLPSTLPWVFLPSKNDIE